MEAPGKRKREGEGGGSLPAPAPPSLSLGTSSMRDVNVYKRERQIGSGTFGQVYLASERGQPNVLVALKRINMEMESNGFPITAIREIRLLKALRHRNFVELKEIVTSKGEKDCRPPSCH